MRLHSSKELEGTPSSEKLIELRLRKLSTASSNVFADPSEVDRNTLHHGTSTLEYLDRCFEAKFESPPSMRTRTEGWYGRRKKSTLLRKMMLRSDVVNRSDLWQRTLCEDALGTVSSCGGSLGIRQ